MTKQTQFYGNLIFLSNLRRHMRKPVASPGPLFSPGGAAKCVRGPSVQGSHRSAPSGMACRAPTFLNPRLCTASKRNDVMAGLSCASTVSW